MHARVVGDGEDEAALDRDEGGVDEGVGGHVETDVLHRDDGARAGEGGAEGFLVGGLLVGAPGRAGALARLVEAEQVLEDLRRGRARIAVGRAQAGVDGAERDSLVA